MILHSILLLLAVTEHVFGNGNEYSDDTQLLLEPAIGQWCSNYAAGGLTSDLSYVSTTYASAPFSCPILHQNTARDVSSLDEPVGDSGIVNRKPHYNGSAYFDGTVVGTHATREPAEPYSF